MRTYTQDAHVCKDIMVPCAAQYAKAYRSKAKGCRQQHLLCQVIPEGCPKHCLDSALPGSWWHAAAAALKHVESAD